MQRASQGGCLSIFVKNILRSITFGKIVNAYCIFKNLFPSFKNSGPIQTFEIDLFEKIANNSKTITIFT